MNKRITFQAEDPLRQHFVEAIDVTRRGGGLTKTAGELHPELACYIKDLRPDPRYQYVLMAPMGSSDVWGPNVNGDSFPSLSLKFDYLSGVGLNETINALVRDHLTPHGKSLPPGNYTKFGHKTFLDALRYRHHCNKNPDIAYGDITFVVWNPRMSRVELVTRHDREKAKRVGADEIIRDLDEGKSRDISMGCRVPFDVCSICGHISRTTSDYCTHLKTMMGQILSDGRVVCAINLFPKFFDLSDVIVPAAKESGVLMKVANAQRGVEIRKKADVAKRAEIKKNILPNVGREMIRRCSSREPQIHSTILRDERTPFPKLLTTLAMMGIALRPEEFQTGLLSRMGAGDLASRLLRRREIFRPVPVKGRFRFDTDDFSPQLAQVLSHLLRDRSSFYPHLPSRVIRISIIRPAERRGVVSVGENSNSLRKVAEAYGAYVSSFRDLPRSLDIALSRHPGYYHQNFFGDLVEDSHMKLASSPFSATSSEPLVRLHLYRAFESGVSSLPPMSEFGVSSRSPARALLGPVI